MPRSPFSVGMLITTNGRADLLRRSLARLTELTVPEDILVVDDGTEDDSVKQVVRTFETNLPIRYVYHHNPGVTLCCEARNVGLRLMSSPLLITCEPEVMFVTDVVRQMAQLHLTMPKEVLTAGTVYAAPKAGVYDLRQSEKRVGWVATYCALYARSWLMAVNGWDEQFPGSWGWDDTDLITRLGLLGIGQARRPEIEVFHQWHKPNQADQSENEQHFRAKTFHQDMNDKTDMQANKEKEWGVLRPRP